MLLANSKDNDALAIDDDDDAVLHTLQSFLRLEYMGLDAMTVVVKQILADCHDQYYIGCYDRAFAPHRAFARSCYVCVLLSKYVIVLFVKR
jgi:hypothetical protein